MFKGRKAAVMWIGSGIQRLNSEFHIVEPATEKARRRQELDRKNATIRDCQTGQDDRHFFIQLKETQ